MVQPGGSRSGRVESINTSSGGVPKRSVFEALVTELGLDGDRQAHPQFHGGPDRAVVLYSLDVIRDLQQEGHPIAAGAIGENLTVSGIDWTAVVPGTKLRIGAVELEVTKYATPCEAIRHSFADGDVSRVSQKVHPGWSRVCARVLAPGFVQMGDPVTLVPPELVSESSSRSAAPAGREPA